jgi:cytochrome c biogenesis protein CcmG/thiol:disulfide interchange protein DsbE
MRRLHRLAVCAAVAVSAAACAQAPDVARSAAPPQEASAVPSSTAAAADLRASKAAAGIADCPVSDSEVPAVDGGLPDVVLACLGGGRPTRLAGLRGRPMLINVWAQWCEPCRQEAPHLAEIARAGPDGLLVLGIDFNDPRPELAIEFADLASWRYPQLADQDKLISAPLQIANIPQTLLVDADGHVVSRHAGPYESAEEIREALRQHLGLTT